MYVLGIAKSEKEGELSQRFMNATAVRGWQRGQQNKKTGRTGRTEKMERNRVGGVRRMRRRGKKIERRTKGHERYVV